MCDKPVFMQWGALMQHATGFWVGLRWAMLCSAALFCFAPPAGAALQPGATAPMFTAPASRAGKAFTFALAKALRKGPVVVYFYPAAYTRGCDLEAHTFATRMIDFTTSGASVIGVSADSIQRLNEFSADPDYCAGKFPVASDPDGKIAAGFGLQMKPPQPGARDTRGMDVTHGFLPRTTFVLDANGAIVATLSSDTDGLNPVEHVTRSLAIVRELRAKAAR